MISSPWGRGQGSGGRGQRLGTEGPGTERPRGDAAGFGCISPLCSEAGKLRASAKIENVLSHLPNGEGDGHPTALGFQHPREPGHPPPHPWARRGWEQGCWSVKRVVSPYPHPYFVSKFLVFLSLWVWLRGKIVTIKKFPAKSSRIMSYGPFWPLPTASGWQAARKGPPGR